MNQLLIISGGILIALGVLQKPKKSDMVEAPIANDVPKPDESEPKTDNVDDCDKSDSGDAI
jgi:hypothetical protein